MINSKIIKSIIPFIGTTLIICGFIKLKIIYGYFGIGIHNYLEFSEILTLFLPDIIRSSLILSFALFIVYLFISTDRIDKNTKEHKAIMESTSFWKRLKLIYLQFNFISVYSIFIFIISIILFFWFPEKLRDYIIANAFMPCMFIFIVLNFEFKRKYNLIHNYSVTSSQSMLYFIIFAFVVQTILSGYSEIRKIEKHKFNVVFQYNGERIKSDDNNLFIGQTRNYIFIKNICSKTSFVYDKKGVTNLEIIN